MFFKERQCTFAFRDKHCVEYDPKYYSEVLQSHIESLEKKIKNWEGIFGLSYFAI